MNGHEWLARKLQQNKIRYTKHDNAFVWIEDLAKAQKFSDRFCALDWPRLLNRYAKKINPLFNDLLNGYRPRRGVENDVAGGPDGRRY